MQITTVCRGRASIGQSSSMLPSRVAGGEYHCLRVVAMSQRNAGVG